MSALQSKIVQFGLTEVYRSPDPPAVDIVFVHGLNGHPYNSWAAPDKSLFWPADLLPDVLGSKRVRILSYGYDANVHAFTDGASNDRIHNHAETLASKLAANRNLRECSDHPIIFVCHSLGGLVVKRALIHCKNVSSEKIEHLRSIYVSTYGILFLGTPHNGSDIARWGALLQNICSAVLPKRFLETSPHLVKALRTNNETLQNINSLFAEIMGRFHVYFFHESRSTDVKGSREVIVDESSAAPYLEGVERMGIDADHSSMCKFDGENAPGYEVVAEALLRYSRDSPSVILKRWHEEMHLRDTAKRTKAEEIFGTSVGPTGGSLPDLRLPGNLHPRRPIDERPSPTSDTSQSADLSSSRRSQKPPFIVPLGFHPNSNFIGMMGELESLHKLLFKENKRDERLMTVLITGVPGSGKTHLAREYVWSQRESFPGGIFWIDAKSTQSICKCFWDIAQAAALIDGKELGNTEANSAHDYISAVREWLQSREEWLLIFDGLHFGQDDELNDFKQFLPFNTRCSIIYTSVDKTLRKKQRLFEPYCLKIHPLKPQEACKLLFKDLGIRKPTNGQVRKATELVTHYQCLPLAIHAISHRLSSTSKPIEKYHVNSHLTDEKLAEPFLGIMHDLYQLQHFEALNLINIMSFLGHHIPVGLLSLGRTALETWRVEILAPSRSGAQGDIDTTLGILIRCGLIERVTDTYTVYPNHLRSDNDSVDVKAVTPELSESQTESSQETFLSSPTTRTIDVIKIHSVVQGFCRDELKIMDEEQHISSGADAGYYNSWLIVAARVLCTSLENARAKTMHDVLPRDYREYETHASRLLDHFPKKDTPRPQLVREAEKEVRKLLESIGHEVNRTPISASHVSIQKQRSVFDTSSSSSSSAPDSSTDETSRQVTWDWSDAVSTKAESPEDIVPPPHCFNLAPFPPHIYRESSLGKDAGYETDSEGLRGALRASPMVSTDSQGTERPKSSSTSSPHMDDREWHLVEKPSRSKLGKEKHKRRRRGLNRGFQKPKPAVPLLNMFHVEGRGASSELDSSRHSSFASSEAERALTAVHKGSPPSSHGETTKAADYSVFGKENAPTYVTGAASRIIGEEQGSRFSQRSLSLPGGQSRLGPGLQAKSSGESLESRITNPHASRLSSELKPDQLSHSVSSEAYLGPDRPQLNITDARTAPGTRYHSRNASSMGQIEPVGDMTASTPGLVSYYPNPVPYEEDIPIAISQRRFGSPPMTAPIAQPIPGTANTHPSAFMPGASPPHSHSSDPPVGSASDPAMSEPMSRGPSGQSNQSWSTEPARYPPRMSPMPSNMAAQFSQQQNLIYGAGGWMPDMQAAGNTLQPEAAHMGPARLRPAPMDEQLAPMYGVSPESQQNIHIGRHIVDVRSARERLVGSSRYPVPHQAPPPAPGYAPYHSNRSGPLIPQEASIPSDIRNGRARSDSSPAQPGYRHV